MKTQLKPNKQLRPQPTRLKTFRIVSDEFELVAGLDPTLLKQAYSLRAKVFCNELKWVSTGLDELEFDQFDATTITMGVVVKGQLVACLRVHPYWQNWMACTVFSKVTPDLNIQQEGTCEVSRLAVDPHYRSRTFVGNRKVSDLIYQCLYAFCAVNNIHTSYMIVSKPTFNILRDSGLGCKMLTPTEHIDAPRDSPLLASLNWHDSVGRVNNERYFSYRAVAKLAEQTCHTIV